MSICEEPIKTIPNLWIKIQMLLNWIWINLTSEELALNMLKAQQMREWQ